MTGKRKALFILIMLSVLSSCSLSKRVSYLSAYSDSTSTTNGVESGKYELKLSPKDILTISVNTTIPESASPFNLGSSAGSGVSIQGGIQGAELQTYIIDKDGYIIFPVIGKIKAAGLTKAELQDLIRDKIYPEYLKEVPIVNVRLKNFQVSVLGEVNRPGSFTISNEQCTILDALALAGDLTIYGKRENIQIIRETGDGEKRFFSVNLQDRNIIYNPEIYYMRQNDVIYVEPNKTRTKAAGIGTAETFSISIVSTMISIATLLITILR